MTERINVKQKEYKYETLIVMLHRAYKKGQKKRIKILKRLLYSMLVN